MRSVREGARIDRQGDLDRSACGTDRRYGLAHGRAVDQQFDLGNAVQVRDLRPELLLASDPLANLEGTSSAIHFDMDVFGLSMVEHNPGIDATAYGLLADFLRAVRAAY